MKQKAAVHISSLLTLVGQPENVHSTSSLKIDMAMFVTSQIYQYNLTPLRLGFEIQVVLGVEVPAEGFGLAAEVVAWGELLEACAVVLCTV